MKECVIAHLEASGGHEHGDNVVEGATVWQRLRNPRTATVVAQNVAMDWSMLWKDLLAGFLIAGLLAAFVPDELWGKLFLQHASPGLHLVGGAVIGPLVAIVTFVCSIGNVPMAAVLWAGGVGFGGVLAFLYGDLIVLPLLDVYRKYYGWKMAAYIGIVFYVTMVAAAIGVDVLFSALHIVPAHPASALRVDSLFKLNYTFWLNLFFGGVAAWLWMINRHNPMEHACHHEPSGAA